MQKGVGGEPLVSQTKKLIFAGAVSVLGFFLAFSPIGTQLDLFWYDSLFVLRGPMPRPDNVIIVAIDEDSFDNLGRKPWPWPRGLHGELLKALTEAGAAVVVFDVLFAEASTLDQDSLFAEAIDATDNAVLVSHVEQVADGNEGLYSETKLVEPKAIRDLTISHLRVGSSDVVVSSDSIVRSLFIEQDSVVGRQRSLALVAAEEYQKKLLGSVSTDAAALDVLRNRPVNINFIGGRGTIKRVSYYQALNPREHLQENFFRDALVFVGHAAGSQVLELGGQRDAYSVPFSRFSGEQMPGVEIHAQAAYGLLNNILLSSAGLPALALIGLIGGWILGWGFLSWHIGWSTLSFLLIVGSSVFASFFNFTQNHFYFSIVPVLLPIILVFILSPFVLYFSSYLEKMFIKKAFATYLSPKLVDALLESPDKLRLGGEEVVATVSFIDLVGFTNMASKLSAQTLIEVTNKTMSVLTGVILAHDGMVDKYMGDCIMAVWGVPLAQSDHALRACHAVGDMRLALEELAKEIKDDYGVDIAARIGLNSGKMIAGNVGGGKRFNYTVLGDEVNLASRLESLNKQYGSDVLLGEETARLVCDELALRELDRVVVKGQTRPVKIFTLIGSPERVTPREYRLNDLYQNGRRRYLDRDWQGAVELLEKAVELYPEDGPCRELLSRSRLYSFDPPPENWDGVYRPSSK